MRIKDASLLWIESLKEIKLKIEIMDIWEKEDISAEEYIAATTRLETLLWVIDSSDSDFVV